VAALEVKNRAVCVLTLFTAGLDGGAVCVVTLFTAGLDDGAVWVATLLVAGFGGVGRAIPSAAIVSFIRLSLIFSRTYEIS